MSALSADAAIALLGLAPHPEGGWYRETFRDPRADAAGRAASSLIYFLLRAGERSGWHRIDAAEVWHFYAGAPVEVALSADGRAPSRHRLGADLAAGERPQLVVPAGWLQSATMLADATRDEWSLVGCSVAPGFEFARFKLMPPDWAPGG